MTQNQIEYFKSLETKRHNLAVEAEQKRYNEEYLKELSRHNISGEGLSKYATDVNARTQSLTANIAKAASVYAAGVNNEHYARMDSESQRHNQASEQMTSLYNSGYLQIQQERADNDYIIGLTNAQAAEKQANVAEQRVDETARQFNLMFPYNTANIESEIGRRSVQNGADISRETRMWIDQANKLVPTITSFIK